ncbi:hypothetical protein AMECASPLE_018778 [Ameca splendens]|uniref:Secreted protein n=1 Tax=Ameca splendens TaxID=208324 RepID=A0ABV1A974_9TELE
MTLPCRTSLTFFIPTGAMVATVVEVPPLAGGLLVRTPALSVSVVMFLGKTFYPPCLLMVVRGLGGACVWQPHICHCAPGQLWLHCSSPLSVCECVYEWVND